MKGPLTESWQRFRFYESMSAAFGKSRKPLLLYLDDMQWCDLDSFEWLNALLTSPAAAGVLELGGRVRRALLQGVRVEGAVGGVLRTSTT